MNITIVYDPPEWEDRSDGMDTEPFTDRTPWKHPVITSSDDDVDDPLIISD